MVFAARVMLAGVLAAMGLPAAAQQNEPQQIATPDTQTPDMHWLRDEQSGCKAPDPKFTDGDGIVWLGACPNGVIDGPGTLTLINKGQPQVTITGTFHDGNLESGHATLSWPDGSKYDGEQTGGRFNGQGVFVSAQQDRLQGNWKDGTLSGDAAVAWANGNHYQGGWSNGKAEGHGVETWANGDRYEGDWHAGMAQGHGVQVWANGQRYDGEWQDDMPNGIGKLVRPDGTQLVGKFVDGHPVEQSAQTAASETQQAAAQEPPTPQDAAAQPAPSAAPAAQAGPVNPPPASPPDAAPSQDTAHKNLSQIEGKNLIAVDGSHLALDAADGGFTREITKADGTSASTAFTFVNERMGTVANANDPSQVTGLFKITENEIDIDFSDGHSEVLKPALGGVALALHTPQGGSTCMVWYPEGHVFSDSERKAALADYASKLGVAYKVSGRRGAKLSSACTASTLAAASVLPAAAAASAAVLSLKDLPHPLPRPIQASFQIPTPTAAPPVPANHSIPALAAIEVRPSEVHLIDAPQPNFPNFAGGQFAAPAQGKLEPTAPAAVSLPAAPSSVSPPQTTAAAQSAPAPAPTAVTAANPYRPDLTDSGASSCLSVASDGTHWGFKNSCAYTVQFAYCLKGEAEVLASCKDGAIGGSAAPNSFSALVGDVSMREKSVDHQFRWVACSGGAGEVIPKLDNVDPPIGRCLRARQASN
jgi:hypothetical protein